MTVAEAVMVAGLIADLAKRFGPGSEAARLAQLAAAFAHGAGEALAEGRWEEWAGRRVLDVLPAPLDAGAEIAARDAELAARLQHPEE